MLYCRAAVADQTIAIPNRAFFKASEVCELAQLQAYVLRTWELEFPSLGVRRPGTSQRIYRRQDVEQVLQIKQLVFTEGLTLGGARRRLEGDVPVSPAEDISFGALVAPEVRAKLAEIKSGLRSILTILSPAAPAGDVGPHAAGAAEASSGEESAADVLAFDLSGRQAQGRTDRTPPRGTAGRRPARGPRQPKRRG